MANRLTVYGVITLALALGVSPPASGRDDPISAPDDGAHSTSHEPGGGPETKTTHQEPQLTLHENGSGRNAVLMVRRTDPGANASQAVAFFLDPNAALFHLDVGGNLNSRARIHLGDLSEPHNPVTMLGKVGIGTTDPGSFQLAVNGAIRTKEVVVETGWSDFVFEEGYPLRGLPELKTYIEAQGHLPDMPSAAEVAAHGVPLGAMQARLLQKVEELTLHLIATNERLVTLERENRRLHAAIEASEAPR